MSRIDAYFSKRKSRVHTHLESNAGRVVQAPEPVYDLVKKPSASTQKTVKKNSILYYLSKPVEQPILCQIRSNIPLTDVWHTVLEEFDAQLPLPDLQEPVEHTQASKISRKRLAQDQQANDRNVRIRTKANVFTLCMEDYLTEEEEEEEDLSRPIRTRHSFEATHVYLLAVTNEFSSIWQ